MRSLYELSEIPNQLYNHLPIILNKFERPRPLQQELEALGVILDFQQNRLAH